MKTLLLLALILTCSAADLEQITLADGRRLIGYYDETAGKLTIDGPAKAVLPIAPKQIVSRSPYVRASEPEPTKPTETARPTKPVDATATLRAAIAEIESERAKITRQELAAYVTWLRAQDTTPLPVAELGTDPRKSEVEAANRNKVENHHRRTWVNLLEKADKIKEDQQFFSWVQSIRGPVDSYLDWKAKGSPVESR